jgi:hypothetical protein
MRKILSSSLVLFLLQTVFFFATIPAQTSSATSTEQIVKPALAFGLADGTPVKLRTTTTLSSADARTGDTVDFEVLEDIRIGEVVVIPRGGTALGTVTKAKRKGRMAQGGKLDITIDYVKLLSGEKVALRAAKETRGGNYTGAMTGAIVASGILFFPAAPFFLFMKGKNITIPKGTNITAYVNGDAPLDRSKFVATNPAQKVAPSLVLTQPVATESFPLSIDSTYVLIKSTPDGAQIIIDGKSVGTTPLRIPLKFGDHVIAITKTGYPLWQRTVTLSSGISVDIDAKLERP